MAEQPDTAAELCALWRWRTELAEHDWARLYGLVKQCLAGQSKDLLDKLPGSAAEYIEDFFLDKAF